jgi:hypothetical protein
MQARQTELNNLANLTLDLTAVSISKFLFVVYWKMVLLTKRAPGKGSLELRLFHFEWAAFVRERRYSL